MARVGRWACVRSSLCQRSKQRSTQTHSARSGAFRMNRLAAKTFEGEDVTGCTGPAFTAADVPQDLLPELACELLGVWLPIGISAVEPACHPSAL